MSHITVENNDVAVIVQSLNANVDGIQSYYGTMGCPKSIGSLSGGRMGGTSRWYIKNLWGSLWKPSVELMFLNTDTAESAFIVCYTTSPDWTMQNQYNNEQVQPVQQMKRREWDGRLSVLQVLE